MCATQGLGGEQGGAELTWRVGNDPFETHCGLFADRTGKVDGVSAIREEVGLPGASIRYASIAVETDTGLDARRPIYDNRTVTAFGGYVALKPFTDQLRLRQRFARSIRIHKGQGFTIPELGCWFVDTKLLGVERLSHVDVVRGDPLLSAMNGLDAMPAGVTEERYLRRFGAPHNAAFEGLNTAVVTWLTRRALTARQRRVVCDCDTSTMAAYGKQEGADRGRSFRRSPPGSG